MFLGKTHLIIAENLRTGGQHVWKANVGGTHLVCLLYCGKFPRGALDVIRIFVWVVYEG